MLTACGGVANAEQTQILTPCQLHEQWARATYGSREWHPTQRSTSGVVTATPRSGRRTVTGTPR